MKKYYLLSTTEGCATNLLENASYRDLYEKQGHSLAVSPEDADVILINTCGYNQQMEDRASKLISDFQRKYQGKEIVVAGCLPKINPALLKKNFHGTVLQTNPRTVEFSKLNQFNKADFERLSKKHRLILKLRPAYFAVERWLGKRFEPLHNIFKTVVVNEEFHLITVSTGCLGKCTFCAIKRAKGSLRSRPLATLVAEFDAGLEAGRRNFWLLGDDIGCWGQDLQLNITDLLDAILARKQDFSLVLNYLDPQYLVKYPERLVELLSDPRVAGINIPIQSASARILEAMGRQYEVKTVFNLLKQIKRRNPGLAIKTNLMVGFPGESWRDFFKSVASVTQFDAILALKFAARPHTPAEKFERQVSETIKGLRAVLINLAILRRHLAVALSSITDSS